MKPSFADFADMTCHLRMTVSPAGSNVVELILMEQPVIAVLPRLLMKEVAVMANMGRKGRRHSEGILRMRWHIMLPTMPLIAGLKGKAVAWRHCSRYCWAVSGCSIFILERLQPEL